MGDTNGFGGGNRGDEDARKLFVGGLPPHATKEDIEQYFGQFGEVEMCNLKTDQFSGRSRGFGFLIYKDVNSVNQVLSNPSGHEIGGKTIDPKLATPQGGSGGQDREKSTKVFVGGLEKTTEKDTITATFGARGNVVDVYLPTDKMTGEKKGFAFVNFDSSEVAELLISEGKIIVDGKECDVKRANNKSDSQRGGFRGGFQGGQRGFGGRGRGGYGQGGYDQYGGGGQYGGYNQYGGGGYGQGYQGGYGGSGGQYGGGGGYEQYNSGGYDQSGGYGN